MRRSDRQFIHTTSREIRMAQGIASVACESCGKQFRWRQEIAGRRMKCPCGGVVTVPTSAPAAIDDLGVMPDHADVRPGRRAVASPVGAPAGAVAARSSAGPRVNAAAIMAAKGLPPPRGKSSLLKDLETAKSGQEELEEMAKTNLLRDVIIPIPIIVAGLALSYLNVTQYPMPGKVAAPPGAAVGMVAVGAVASVVLVVGAIFLTTVLADVTFVGSFANSVLRLCAIAIGPSSIYGIMAAVVTGDSTDASMAGTALGAFLTIFVLGLLYWGLLRLDLKDTGVCVMITFFLMMFSQYMMWRMEGIMKGSDI
jgi:hypothetical protein